MKRSSNGPDSLEIGIAYVHGRIEAQIEGYAKDLHIPSQLLAQRLAALLHPSGAGSVDHLPQLRRKAPQDRAPVGKVEVAEHAHGKTSQSRALIGRPPKNKKKRAMKSYWQNMTPEQRAAEVARRTKVRADNRAKKAA